ncbi:hypothetical protein PbB2_02736 [Candidatus Phycosocius bacilliformis]|uniref:Ig-like domain-containing protein n=1 Tax=Candidatus Phycosocius bacilliformis TaxID=1445552 RepID=A0A2P2EDB6_9PROT|nr:hypothetical protein [Candidatus Phycosocius bacilliformis]GBF59044.1 hypothetical protein PbB2_02736 [Candidatus Phycosocius bacilliformis]
MVKSYIVIQLCLYSVLLCGGCGQSPTAHVSAKPNQVWNPKIELELTWPKGVNGPPGNGVYLSLLDQYAPPVPLNQITGDYLVVANRYPDSSKGTVSLLINEQEIPNVVTAGEREKYWSLSTRLTIKCPVTPKTVIPPPEIIALDASVYSVICVSERGITRILTSDIDFGENFPTEISEKAEIFLSRMGIVLSPSP